MNVKSLTIKDWAEDDRPREKLLGKGARHMSDAELLAIILGSGSKNESVVELSRRILASYDNDLDKLSKAAIPQLLQFKGVGEAKAVNIIAAAELGRRMKQQAPKKNLVIKSSDDVASIMHPILGDLPHEEFWIILVNQANKVIDKQRISSGGLTGTMVDVRIVMKYAIENSATGIILCHNHPSGNNFPSRNDENLTKLIVDAAKVMDIRILDHVIIAHDKHYSFMQEGLL